MVSRKGRECMGSRLVRLNAASVLREIGEGLGDALGLEMQEVICLFSRSRRDCREALEAEFGNNLLANPRPYYAVPRYAISEHVR